MIAPFDQAVELLDTITGVDRRTAEGIVAEIEVDMQQFGSAERPASWAGMCPGNPTSAGKSRSGKSSKGSKWLGIHLTEAAKAAARSKTPTFRRSTSVCEYQRDPPRNQGGGPQSRLPGDSRSHSRLADLTPGT